MLDSITRNGFIAFLCMVAILLTGENFYAQHEQTVRNGQLIKACSSKPGISCTYQSR